MTFDLIIRDVDVIDGTGAPAYRADVAVSGDRIVCIGRGLGQAGRDVDGSNRCLSPGFIDVHSHDDFAALLEPELAFKLEQGVTTEIVGNCGMGAAPFAGARELIETMHPGATFEPWQGYGSFLSRLESEPASANLAVLAGHGSIRNEVLHGASRAATRNEVTAMRAFVDEALAAGVIGFSTGLIYPPGRDATTNELVELARPVGKAGAIYTTHLRSEANDLLDAIDEALFVAREAEVGLQLSHHKAHGRNNWGKVTESLARIDAAVKGGLDVHLDLYPYAAGSTMLSAVVDSGSLTGVGRMGEIRPEDVVLAAVVGHSNLDGTSLGALMDAWGGSALEVAERVLALDGGAWVVVHGMCEPDVRRVMSHERAMIGSDGIPTPGGRPHPRLYGTFPRVIGHYARDEGVLSLTEAVRRMTGLPARRFGLRDRGVVVEGAFADLVLFDPRTIADAATFESPRERPRGVERVFVNGREVVRDGIHTGARPGRVLRRI